MTAAVAVPKVRIHDNAYEIFILVLTVMSLIVMALVILPLSPATHETLLWFDNAICVVFLADFAVQHHRLEAAERVLHPPPGLAGPAGLDPDPRRVPVHRAVPPRPALAAGPDHATAQRAAQAGADRRHRQEPRPVRAVRVVAADVHRPVDGDGPRAPVRVPLAGREHRDRRRRAVVGLRHAHHGGLRGLLPGDHAGPRDRRRSDGGRHRAHRRPRQHPGQRPRPSPQEQAEAATEAGSDDKAALDERLSAIQDELVAIREELRAIRGPAGGPAEAEPPTDSR